MAIGDTPITIVGNVVADPELRFTPSGTAVCNFRVASTPRVYNRDAGQYEDGEALFLTVNIWRQAAEHVAETLSKGMRVIVQGNLKQRSYETKQGEKRTSYEIEADEVGPSLKFATAQVNRNPRQGGGSAGGWNNANSASGGPSGGSAGDPWNSGPQGGFGGAQGDSDTPPF